MTVFFYRFYRKRGGKVKVTPGQFAALFLILGWFLVVMVLTTFSRGENFEGWVNFQLFSGYVSAWNQWSLSEWQLIIFNMLMFVPFGFLLPILSQKTRRFVPVALLSLFVTIGIELIQMLSRRGIFELDDILHNTLGSIAGFFLISAIMDSIKNRKIAMKSVIKALVIPMAFVLLFLGAITAYHSKELGNLSIRPAIPQNMEGVEVINNSTLSKDIESVSLYFSDKIHNLDYGKEMATLIMESFDLQQKGGIRKDSFNRIWSFHNKDGIEYTFNYNLADGSWSLYTEEGVPGPFEQEELSRFKEYYESWMFADGILPEETVFQIQNEDTLRWELEHNMTDIAIGDRDFANGVIMIVPSQEQNPPNSLNYFMTENKYIRKINIISPAEAYKDIVKGDFEIYNNLKKGDVLQVNEYELTYIHDSKGYYQPVYQFIGELNGEYWEALIPAVK